jgi:hypothetical protein
MSPTQRQPIAGTNARGREKSDPVQNAATTTMAVEHAPRMNTLSPVGSEPETSFIDAAPQVNTAVATIMARIPLRFPAANGGRCGRTNDPGPISPLSRTCPRVAFGPYQQATTGGVSSKIVSLCPIRMKPEPHARTSPNGVRQPLPAAATRQAANAVGADGSVLPGGDAAASRLADPQRLIA